MAAPMCGAFRRAIPVWHPLLNHVVYRNIQNTTPLLIVTSSSHGRKYYSSNILDLHDRGLFHDIFPGASPQLPVLLKSSPQTVYCGFDPTADSLHVGNLLCIIGLIHCLRAGHHAIAVVGGATALIGDPSGKTSERERLSEETVRENVEKITENINRVVDNHDSLLWNKEPTKSRLRIVNNADWYKSENLVEFLATTGRMFRMGNMLSKHSVRTRLKSSEGMSLSEFSYQVFQAFDFLHLHQTYGCTLQLGGSDQMGNMKAGYELIQRVSDGAEVYGLTVPLVTSTQGDKLGKTAGNAVWLDSTKTSPYDLYQYFLRLPDEDVDRYLKLFTFLSLKEIQSISNKQKSQPAKTPGQHKLAEVLTMLVHGSEGLDSAIRCTDALFHSEGPEHLENLNKAELSTLFRDVSTVKLEFVPGMSLIELTMFAKCFPTIRRANEVIEEGGVSINHMREDNPNRVLVPNIHVLKNGITLLRIGKRHHYLIKWHQ